MGAITAPQGLRRLRWGVLGLTVMSALFGMTELAILGHTGGIQYVPWAIFAAVLVAAILLAISRSKPTRYLARIVGVAGAAGAGFGSWKHLERNLEVGPFHAVHGPTWESTSAIGQWWLAFSGELGNNPSLAPGLLGFAGVLLILVTLGPELGPDGIIA